MKKKKSKSRPAASAQGKDMGKHEGEGGILAEIDKAGQWEKPKTAAEKVFNLADKIF